MTVDNHNINNLKINLLTLDQYNNQQETSQDEIYVVNETSDLDDPANILSSKTYADKGREAIVTQTSEPTSQYTQIWINPEEEVVYITPANSDMDNITETGSANIVKALTPDFDSSISYSQSTGNSFTVDDTGWLYVFAGSSSTIELKKTNIAGVDLITIKTSESTKQSNHILIEKNTTVYINERSGSITINFIPCKGL